VFEWEFRVSKLRKSFIGMVSAFNRYIIFLLPIIVSSAIALVNFQSEKISTPWLIWLLVSLLMVNVVDLVILFIALRNLRKAERVISSK